MKWEGEDIWTCSYSAGPDGGVTTYWNYEPLVCRRTNDDCLAIFDEVMLCGTKSRRIDVTSPCQDRTPVSCTPQTNAQDQSAQVELDNTIDELVNSCFDPLSPSYSGALTVWFNGDCPTSFLVYPPEIADCVRGKLETVCFDCAAGLFCGTSDYVQVGGCAC